MPPAGPRHPAPPLPPVAQVHRARSGREDQRAGHQVLRCRPRVQRWVEFLFGDGDVAGVGDELGELGIGDGVAFDGDGVDGDGVRRRLFWIELRRPHPVRPARELDELGEHGFHGMTIAKSCIKMDAAASNPAVPVGACMCTATR